MRKPALALFCLALLVQAGVAAEPANPPLIVPATSSAYFKDLREAYAKAQPGIISWAGSDERKALLALYDEKAPAKFLEAYPRWLVKCPVDSRIHIMAASLLSDAGRYEESIRHRSYFYGLLASILNSGDGKAQKSAYKVISVDEEYALLNFMGAELGKQSLVGQCDVMDVKINGNRTDIFFDVSIHLEALQRALSSGK